MKLNKKQLKAIIDVLNNNTPSHVALQAICIKGGYAYATDGYVLAKMKTTAIKDNDFQTYRIPVEELVKVYKLMERGQEFTDLAAESMMELYEDTIPDLEKLTSNKEFTSVSEIALDPTFVARGMGIIGTSRVKLEFTNDSGYDGPVFMTDESGTTDILVLVMPLLSKK